MTTRFNIEQWGSKNKIKWVLVEAAPLSESGLNEILFGADTKKNLETIAKTLDYQIAGRNAPYEIVKLEDLKQKEESNDKVQVVIDAWTNEGPAPQFHKFMQGRLKAKWPTLFEALEDLTNGT